MVHRLTSTRQPASRDETKRVFCTRGVERIECELCGSRSYSGIRANDTTAAEGVHAAFIARGWRVVSRDGRTMQVCRGCARKLGPQWVDVTVDLAEVNA